MGPQDWFWPESDSWPTQAPRTSEYVQQQEIIVTSEPHHSNTEVSFGTSHEGEHDDVAEYREFCETNELIRNNPNNDTGT